MSVALREKGIRAVVLDIEGTTTPVSFVYDVLFPFARRELRAYIREHIDSPDLANTIAQLHVEWQHETDTAPPWREGTREQRIESVVSYAEWQMDRDRKSPALKALQGRIWERGYDARILRGEVFPDVAEALSRWRTAGVQVAIFSSGSVLAQQTLFRTTRFGDLTRLVDAYFDTAVGPKHSPDSYRRIAAELHCPPEAVLFISDTPAELSAAQSAGFVVLMCSRPGHEASSEGWDVVSDFTGI